MLKSNAAQSTLEYAIIVAVVVAALIAIQVYFKRGVQGHLRGQSVAIGEEYCPGQTVIYQQKDVTAATTENTSGGLTTTERDETTQQSGGRWVWK
ncbi:MAG: hypothetical protein WC486_04415 [Candidatus Omnitrophota bacterium]|jgi:Flp pilus assembly pilin Flp|nr:hypothetical protein [Candidatus Omnitrophota bacterium]